MPLLRATVNLERNSSPDRDDVQNVFHAVSPAGAQGAHAANLGLRLAAFYQGLSGIYSDLIVRNQVVHEVRIAEVTPGGAGQDDDVVSPLINTTRFDMTVDDGASTPFPAEVGITLSFEGDTAGIPEEVGDPNNPR